MAAAQPTFGDILAARERLGGLAHRTPLIEHPGLNARAGGRVQSLGVHYGSEGQGADGRVRGGPPRNAPLGTDPVGGQPRLMGSEQPLIL